MHLLEHLSGCLVAIFLPVLLCSSNLAQAGTVNDQPSVHAPSHKLSEQAIRPVDSAPLGLSDQVSIGRNKIFRPATDWEASHQQKLLKRSQEEKAMPVQLTPQSLRRRAHTARPEVEGAEGVHGERHSSRLYSPRYVQRVHGC